MDIYVSDERALLQEDRQIKHMYQYVIHTHLTFCVKVLHVTKVNLQLGILLPQPPGC